ncbi:MAG: TolC family protein [Candidatus Melainabacteria bacterium]
MSPLPMRAHIIPTAFNRLTLGLLTTSVLLTQPVLVSAHAEAMPVDQNGVQNNDSRPETIQLQTGILKSETLPIDLATVLALADRQNLLIARQSKNSEIMANRAWQRGAALLPNIEGSYNQSRLEGGQQIFGEVVTVVRKTAQPQLTASWTLYPGGRNVYELLAARQRSKAAESTMAGTRQEQLALAAGDYYSLLAAYQQRTVVQRNLAEAQEQININQARVDVGNGIPLDLSRAKTTYAQQQSAMIEADNAVALAEQTLLNRLNLDVDVHLTPDEREARENTLLQTPTTVNALIGIAVASNPTLAASAETLKAIGHDYRTVRSDLIPSVTLRSYVNGTGPDLQNLTRTTFGGLTVNINLLDNLGLQTPLRMQEQKKLMAQQELVRQAEKRDIETAVSSAYLSSETYRQAMAAADTAVQSAEESYELATGRFQAGYGVNLDVLTALSELAAARKSRIDAILNYNRAQVQLLSALGVATPETLVNGWQPTNAKGNATP